MLKPILQVLLFVAFFSNVSANDFKEAVTIKLKKDEFKKILVLTGKGTKLFKFRWTLYTNGGLIILRSYDKIVAQNVLYAKNKRQSFKVELNTRGDKYFNIPYLMVKFVKFDYETREAEFTMFLSDVNSKVSLEYLEDEI